MTTPSLRPEQIRRISAAVAHYIAEQRIRYAPRAAALTEPQRAAMAGFFTPAILNTRLVTLDGERVSNPDFYPVLRMLGFRKLPDQSAMNAVTFFDIVVSHVPFDNGLLFHELVHAEQYRQLGIERFSELYVTGFLKGGGYDGISLEVQAYELGARYEIDPRRPFSVEELVSDYIRREIH